MTDLVFIHGMFQTPSSWSRWIDYFTARGFTCAAPAWPLHDGEPRALRENPPEGLGDLHLSDVLDSIRADLRGRDRPAMIGHSVGGLITQLMLAEGLISAGVALDPVAPNAMVDLDWGFIKNSATIANPLKGDQPILMDAKTFHDAFANTLDEAAATREFEAGAVHDSRNVLRGCLGPDGRIDMDKPRGPLLLIGGTEDHIIPAHLTEKNAKAYSDAGSVTEYAAFPRSHYICNEPGWEEVAARAAAFLDQHARPSAPTA